MRTIFLVSLALVGCGSSSRPPEPPVAPSSQSNLDIADDALPLIDAWAEALGGREAIAKLGTVHQKGECTLSGEPCTFESFLSPRGEVRYTLTFADRAYVSAFDGTSAWLQEGTTVSDVGGEDLEAVLRTSFLESYSMFFPDRRAGSITRDGASSVAILPKGVTKPLIVRFRSDNQPVSAESPGFRVVFQGWNEYLGVQVPQSWASGEKGTENSFRVSSIDDQQGTYAKPAP